MYRQCLKRKLLRQVARPKVDSIVKCPRYILEWSGAWMILKSNLLRVQECRYLYIGIAFWKLHVMKAFMADFHFYFIFANKCMTKSLVYRADITDSSSGNTKSYFGQCMRTFKERYREHTTSFSTPQKEIVKKDKELAAHVWKLKEERRPFNISWHIQRRAYPYRNGERVCNLCSWEKFYILMADPNTTVNSRSELFFRCKSQRDCLLDNKDKFTPKPP